MKKNILSVLSLISACTISATQYMHVNLADGKEYDVKVEKTDKVSHVEKDGEVFIKVERKDNSYTLYPMDGAEITFDEKIARMDGNVSDWSVKKASIEGCVYDTSKVQRLREAGENEFVIYRALADAQNTYSNCVSKKKSELVKPYSDAEVETISAANEYAKDLFTKITKDKKETNVVFSPTSLQYALAMLANGADNDDAYAEITTALGKQNIPLDQLNEIYAKRTSVISTVDTSKVKIGVANATFLQNDIPFGKNFLQNLNDFYNATANNVDFRKDSTFTLMDKWASDNTDGMIKKIGVDPHPDLVLVIANALSFKSTWEDSFYKPATDTSKFVTSEGEEKQVMKMHKTKEGGYAEDENYQLVTLNFFDGYKMNVILPKEGVDPVSVLAEIDLDNIAYKHGFDTIYCPKISLPKFNTDTKIPLNVVLAEMGFKNTFEQYFNNITDQAQVSKINQLTHLEVDEEGAKGAAVTTIAVNKVTSAGPRNYKYIDFDVNRPFLVTINNPSDHELLFVGLINDPEK